MSNRFNDPDLQFSDASGLPYIGGFLFFYQSGTSTPQTVYSDEALTSARTNPIILDSAGRAGSVFLQNLAYKVVLEDANNNQIWTMDPVYSSDISTLAQFQSYNGNPNGHVAGTQGSGSQPASVVWDYADNVLYVATTTGDAATTVWTPVNPPSAAVSAGIPQPQGYLTLSADPINYVVNADTLNATTFYYTAVLGQLIPIYNGTFLTVQTMATNQLSFNLTGAQSQNNLYDVFAFLDSGVVTLGVGPAWTGATAGSCSRGSGTQLQSIDGILMNANTIAAMALSGGGTINVPANQATYIGSLYIGGSASGQVSCYRSPNGGLGTTSFPQWGVWNAYNKQQILLQALDTTSSWLYGTNTYRQSDSSAGPNSNYIAAFTGLATETILVEFTQLVSASPNTGFIAIGWNSTTSPSGIIATTSSVVQLEAMYNQPPGSVTTSFGLNNIYMLEKASGGNVGFEGTASNMLMTAIYSG